MAQVAKWNTLVSLYFSFHNTFIMTITVNYVLELKELELRRTHKYKQGLSKFLGDFINASSSLYILSQFCCVNLRESLEHKSVYLFFFFFIKYLPSSEGDSVTTRIYVTFV